MSARDFQLLINAFHAYSMMPFIVTLYTFYRPSCNQRVAMNSDELIIKFFLKLSQGLIDNELAALMPDSDVFLICLEITNFMYWHEFNAAPGPRRNVRAPLRAFFIQSAELGFV